MGSGASRERKTAPHPVLTADANGGTEREQEPSAHAKARQQEEAVERTRKELEVERERVQQLTAALKLAEEALDAARRETNTGLSAARAETADANLRVAQLESEISQMQEDVAAAATTTGADEHGQLETIEEPGAAQGVTEAHTSADGKELVHDAGSPRRRRGSDGVPSGDGHGLQAAKSGGRRHSMPVGADMDAVARRWRSGRDRVGSLKALEEGFAKRHPKGFGVELAELKSVSIEAVWLLPVPSLSEYAPSVGTTNKMGMGHVEAEQQEYNKLLGREDVILHDIVRKPDAQPITTAYLRAGPRPLLHFEPSSVRAAIVTCGGLCPGLNNIIQGITRTLLDSYGARRVLGVRGGYQGFSDAPGFEPIDVTIDVVQGIHKKGGTRLGSGRGSFDVDRTLGWLQRHEVNQLYVVGGDGTHRAATKIADEARARKLNIAVRARARRALRTPPHAGCATR